MHIRFMHKTVILHKTFADKAPFSSDDLKIRWSLIDDKSKWKKEFAAVEDTGLFFPFFFFFSFKSDKVWLSLKKTNYAHLGISILCDPFIYIVFFFFYYVRNAVRPTCRLYLGKTPWYINGCLSIFINLFFYLSDSGKFFTESEMTDLNWLQIIYTPLVMVNAFALFK